MLLPSHRDFLGVRRKLFFPSIFIMVTKNLRRENVTSDLFHHKPTAYLYLFIVNKGFHSL
jgi:hypothetical protein